MLSTVYFHFIRKHFLNHWIKFLKNLQTLLSELKNQKLIINFCFVEALVHIENELLTCTHLIWFGSFFFLFYWVVKINLIIIICRRGWCNMNIQVQTTRVSPSILSWYCQTLGCERWFWNATQPHQLKIHFHVALFAKRLDLTHHTHPFFFFFFNLIFWFYYTFDNYIHCKLVYNYILNQFWSQKKKIKISQVVIVIITSWEIRLTFWDYISAWFLFFFFSLLATLKRQEIKIINFFFLLFWIPESGWVGMADWNFYREVLIVLARCRSEAQSIEKNIFKKNLIINYWLKHPKNYTP